MLVEKKKVIIFFPFPPSSVISLKTAKPKDNHAAIGNCKRSQREWIPTALVTI